MLPKFATSLCKSFVIFSHIFVFFAILFRHNCVYFIFNLVQLTNEHCDQDPQDRPGNYLQRRMSHVFLLIFPGEILHQGSEYSQKYTIQQLRLFSRLPSHAHRIVHYDHRKDKADGKLKTSDSGISFRKLL